MPSRLITYAGRMAAPMDIPDAEGGGKGKGGTSGLSVSRSSVKINKNMRRAMTQPRPAPQVYKTEPAEFRSLVQRLTGTSPPAESSSAVLTPKALNPRLQKIAPPPLRPVFSYPSQALPQLSPQTHQMSQITGFNPGPRRSFLHSAMAIQNQLTSQMSRHSNFPVSPLSFSPLPALSPSDQIWANVMNPLESPGAAAMRHLAQSIASRGDIDTSSLPPPPPPLPPMQDTNLANLSLPLDFSRFNTIAPGGDQTSTAAPTFHLPGQQENLASDQTYGLGNMFNYSGPLSPTQASSLSMDDTFSFPDPDHIARTSRFS